MMKIMVTGGAGFIGSHLVEGLIPLHDVVVVDDLSNSTTQNLNLDRIEFKHEKIIRLVPKDFMHIDAVFHLAAINSVPRSFDTPLKVYEANATSSAHIFSICGQMQIPVVFSSSSSVYGINGKLMSPYARSKKLMELYAQMHCDISKLKYIGLRFYNVYGPRQRPDIEYPALIPKWISALMKDEFISIFGDGNQTRNFTYVSDVVSALLDALTLLLGRTVHPRMFDVFGPDAVSVGALAQMLKFKTQSTKEILFLDERPGDIKESSVTTESKVIINAHLGYAPTVALCEGLDRTLKWFASHRS